MGAADAYTNWYILDKDSVTTADLKQYKTILEMPNAHLQGYEPRASIRTSKGVKYKEIISKFSQAPLHVRVVLKPHYVASG